jgi:hypothetical protein
LSSSIKTSIPSATKMPKAKSMPKPTDNPAKFFKSECGLCKGENELEPLMKPYSSEAQRRWAHTTTGKEALGGDAAVHEWDEATKGKKLPEKVKKSEFCKSESPLCKTTEVPGMGSSKRSGKMGMGAIGGEGGRGMGMGMGRRRGLGMGGMGIGIQGGGMGMALSEKGVNKGEIPNPGKQLLDTGGTGVGNMSSGNGGIACSETKHPTLRKFESLLEKSRSKNKS